MAVPCAEPLSNSPYGTYMIVCGNRNIAVVGWNGSGEWQWGSAVKCCASNYMHLGGDIANIRSQTALAAAARFFATSQQMIAINRVWESAQQDGRPFSVTPTGKVDGAQFVSEAQSTVVSAKAPGILGDIGTLIDAIEAPLDFLKWIAWIFHPVNLLRGVEFLTGLVLMGFGFHSMLQGYKVIPNNRNRRQGAIQRTATNIFSATPAGRVAREAKGARAGRRSARRAQRYREYDRSYRSARRKTERRQQKRGKGPQKGRSSGNSTS